LKEAKDCMFATNTFFSTFLFRRLYKPNCLITPVPFL